MKAARRCLWSGASSIKTPDGSFVLKNGKRRKTFKQARPHPDKPGGAWLRNVDGVRVVPYRLPELIEAIGNEHTVFIVEGEAKVELLAIVERAGNLLRGWLQKWRAEHSEFLRGANVVILPDNDDAGRAHCDLVGASLESIANSVRVLDLPGLPAQGRHSRLGAQRRYGIEHNFTT